MLGGLISWTVEVLVIIDGLWIDGLELGLEGIVAGSRAEAVGAAASLEHIVLVVLELRFALTTPGAVSGAHSLRVNLPVALATTLLLGGGWIGAVEACFAEVAWEVLFWGGGAIGEANVVTVGSLVSASHWKMSVSKVDLNLTRLSDVEALDDSV